ncbi:ExbD/TolR family protein [Haloferula chungangensis]|uniref:ExbD/TolR family protein n=1 Tax=Haloferula chungangensis TaxID=1048331 RepID=A0ABW2L8Y9_9BACT
MKLVSTLPERAGFLHAIPLFDLFALLLVFILLGPSFVTFSGVRVEMPMSRYQVERDPNAAVITITQGDPAVIWLERQRVTEADMIRQLAERREKSAAVPTVYIRSDSEIPASYERMVAEAALQQGFRVYLLGRPMKSEELK